MTKTNEPKKTDFFEDFDQTPIIDWLVENKQKIITGLAVLFGGLLLLYYIFSQKAIQAENDYAAAQVALQNINEDHDVQENITLLNSILQRHPELQAKYDAPLAQLMLIKQDPASASVYAERIFKRTQADGLGLFENYGKNSLNVAKGEYQLSYEQAKELKTKMQSNPTSGTDLLYAYNLVRIATLEQQLGDSQAELKTWEELLQAPGLTELSQIYTNGRISFLEHIAARKKALKSS